MESFTHPHLDHLPIARPALVLFSGGQDSTTCLLWAARLFATVEAVAFDYGQRHSVELQQAIEIADCAEVRLHLVDLRGTLGDSALLDADRNVNEAHERAPDLPASFVPGRNALFLTVAASLGFTLGISDLIGGMCQTDYSGYPDCRIEFVRAQERALALALGADVRIHTPLMDLTKAETWKLAADLGTVRGLDVLEVVRELSHTDYHGDRSQRHEWGYGKLDNPASLLRAMGYEEAKQKGWV